MKISSLRRGFHRCFCLAIASFAIGMLSSFSSKDAHAATFQCNPVDVAVFVASRIHVRCNPGDGAIAFFALSVANANEANRVLSIASTALAIGKRLIIFYDPADLSGANVGCDNSDCRLIQAIAMF